jgi:hypothetical protein
MDDRIKTYAQNTARASFAGNTAEVATLGLGFLIEFPIFLIIFIILGFLFGVTILAGLFSLFNNIYFLALLVLLVVGLIFNERYFEMRAMSITLLLAGLFTVLMVYLQYTSMLKTNVVCGIPLIGQFLCTSYEFVLTIPNILYYFIPSFIILGVVMWIRRIL